VKDADEPHEVEKVKRSCGSSSSVMTETPAPSKNIACEDNHKRIARIASYAGGF
jgi:hypothetical protein